MDNIKFGTDGWRAIIADGFTLGNVARISRASARWLVNREKDREASVVIGYDTRFGGKMFAEAAAKVFALTGVSVYLSDRFVSTPMVSYGVISKKASMGVAITASHNSFEYNGFKIKGHYGGPVLDQDLKDIENLIPEMNEIHLDSLHFEEYVDKGLIQYVNLESIYIDNVKENFNLESIEKSRFTFAFDSMYGAGQQVFKQLLPGVHLVNCQQDYSFGGISPEPSATNLKKLEALIRSNGNIDCGLAVDGDADRVAMYDRHANYIDSHHIMLLLIHYLYKYKGFNGKIVTGFSSTARIEKLCMYYGLDFKRVKIGFKEICSVILKEKVLMGGEESGGISVLSHIPDRDGIWTGLLIWQFMVETGKNLHELIEEVYSITGSFACERADLKIDKKRKNEIIENCRKGLFRNFGNRTVQRIENLDGFKFFFNDAEWLMIRSSGTEPLLRIYAESYNRKSALEILEAAEREIMAI